MGWNMLDNVPVHPHTCGKKNLISIKDFEISMLVKLQSIVLLITGGLIWYFSCEQVFFFNSYRVLILFENVIKF